MGIEYVIVISVVATALALRGFTRMFRAEYDAALGTRRLVNASRLRAEAKLRARLAELEAQAAENAA